jgi:ACS family tartrate transporter-like MFS transporter
MIFVYNQNTIYVHQEAHQPDPIAERTRAHVARRLIPFLLFSYFLAYLDRSNIGVAKLGMQHELGFTDEVIGFGAGIFFAGYLLLELPGSVIVERWSARKWIARIMISWGIVASLGGFIGTGLFSFASTARQFYWLRFALGVAEAGFFPGVMVYLSHWFRYEDRSRAKALFLIAQPIAFVVGLPVSRLILEKVDWYGLAGWRWIFIIEGVPTLLLGFVALFYLTDWPSQAKWLPPDEKCWLLEQLEREKQRKEAAGRADIRKVFAEPQVFLIAVLYFFVMTGNQGLGYFLPSITDAMKSMSISWRTVVTMAPFGFGLFGILLNGYLAGRTRERRWHIAVPILLTGLALACAILSGKRLGLVITFLCLMGFTAQAYLPVLWTLPSALLTKSAAAVAVGVIATLASTGGFVGPYIFGYLTTRTGRFEAGMWFLVACILTSGLLATRIKVSKRS